MGAAKTFIHPNLELSELKTVVDPTARPSPTLLFDNHIDK
jgi:hypothetical protein